MKDSLPTNDPAKVIKGAEFSTEFTAIQTAFGQAAPLASPTFTGTATFNNITATGTVTLSSVNINGTVTADGLTVSGNSVLDSEDNFSPDATAANKSLVLASTGATGGSGQLGASVAFSRVNTDSPRAAITAINTDANFERMGLSFWTHPNNTPDTMVKRMQIDHAGDISFYEDTGSAAKLFWSASSERLGIGTTGPTNLLHVAGSSAGALEMARFRLEGATNNPMLKIEADEANQTAGLDVSGSTATELTFSVAGTERARIDGSGNVGIGTDSPSAFSGYTTLSLNNAANGAVVNLLVGGTETGRMQAFSGAFNVAAKGASTNLTFETNGSEAARIDSSGNVGIGTPNPSAPLEVRGDTDELAAVIVGRSDANEEITFGSFGASNPNGIPALLGSSDFGGIIQGGTNGNLVLAIRDNDTSDAVVIISGGGDFMTDDTYDTTVATFKADGKVGIGTASPSAKLEVEDDDFARLDLNLSDASGTTIADVRGLVAGSEKWRLGKTASGSDDFTVNVAGSEALRVDTSGNALIGTTTAAGSLSNTARVTGGIFSTNNGTTSVPNATWTTLTAIPTGDAVYLVTAYLPSSGDPGGYNAVSIVTTSLTGTNLVDIKNANHVALRMSGSNLQVNHGQGTTQPINWSILRLA